MYNIILMHIFNSLQGLCKEPKCFRLSEDGFSVLMVEKIAIISIIHDHIDDIIFQESIP